MRLDLRNSLSVRTRIAACRPCGLALTTLDPLNDLSTSKLTTSKALDEGHIVAHRPELFNHRGVNPVLQEDARVNGSRAIVRHACAQTQAWAVEGALHRQTAQDVEDHLHVSLRLHEAAHHTEAEEEVISACSHSWDNGVVGSFAWCNAVRMAFLEDEACAAVLQREPAVPWNGTGSKASVCASKKKPTSAP